MNVRSHWTLLQVVGRGGSRGGVDSRLSTLFAAGGLLLVCLGCGDRGKPLAPVSGVVTFDGKPLAGGIVNFQPVAAAGSNIAGKGSAATCDDQGRYHMTTVDGQPGAVVGEHRVRIYSPKSKVAASDDRSSSGGEFIPRRYNFDTVLTFPVPSEGTDAANFELTKE